jgi:hypothetical protein
VSIELDYTAGAECGKENGSSEEYEEGEHSVFGLQAVEPSEPGAGAAAYGFIVLENFYSPADPDGNPGLFSNVLVTLEPGYTEEGFAATSSSGFTHSVPMMTYPEEESRRINNSWPVIH